MFKNKKRSGALIQNRKKPKRNIEQSSEISLWLENYDELFSGFDPRPYSHRALSSDFLSETKKASIDKDEKIDLELLIPSNKRNKTKEEIIRKRLRDHFNRHLNLLKTEINHMVWKGFSLAISTDMAKKIHNYVTKISAPGVIFLGVFVALVELPCTGGPYLAVITLLSQNFDLFAFGLLALYNVIFVLPLIIILIMVNSGTKIHTIKKWKQKNRSYMRLLTGLLLIVLGWLLMLIANGTINLG